MAPHGHFGFDEHAAFTTNFRWPPLEENAMGKAAENKSADIRSHAGSSFK